MISNCVTPASQKYSGNSVKSSQDTIMQLILHHEQLDIDKVWIGSWKFRNYRRGQEWQPSIMYLSNLTANLKPSYLNQGLGTRIHRTISWKIDCALVSINATTVSQSGNTHTAALCHQQSKKSAVLLLPVWRWFPWRNCHGVSLRDLDFHVQLIVNALNNILKLHYELDQAIQHAGHKFTQDNLFQRSVSLNVLLRLLVSE